MNHHLAFAHAIFSEFSLTLTPKLFWTNVLQKRDLNMEQDTTNSPDQLSSRSSSSLPECPVLKVLRANKYGLVVESNRSFEIGEEMTIGFHVSNVNDPSHFISAESLVVESQRILSIRGEFCHRVTLLFSDIAPEDQERLIMLSKSSDYAPKSQMAMGLN